MKVGVVLIDIHYFKGIINFIVLFNNVVKNVITCLKNARFVYHFMKIETICIMAKMNLK